MTDEVLVRADHVSKKFCRELKRSLWYGVKDTLEDLAGRDGSTHELRPAEFWALNNVSFELRRGECLGLIGRNGAGKTTLLKMLNGLIKPDNGRIEVRGRLGALIALGAGFNPILSGRENIYVNASVLGLSKREINEKIVQIIGFAEIGEFIDSPVQSYSSGMAVRLGFAIAAAIEPDVLLLDEVLAVGDVGFQAKCFNTLAEFRKRGTCFIFVSHNMHMISRYCQKVMYVRDGHVQHLGDVATGIATFLAEMEPGGTEKISDGPDWSRALGTGRVRLVGSKFLNARNEEVTEINVGDSVTMVVEYERSGSPVNNAILDVVIRDNMQMVFQGTNALSGHTFGSLPEKGKFHIHFDSIPANVDKLDFFVTIHDGDTMEIFDWKRHLTLGVKRCALHNSALVLRTTWSVTT
jgi:lipopolysaccharide transport system ATP-binding protein